MFHMHHPRLLVSLILLVVLAVVASVAVASQSGSDPDGGVVTLLPITPPPTVSPDEAAKAESIVRSFGQVDQLAKGQTWTASGFAFRRVSGHQTAVYLRASWSEPVEARAQWLLLKCQGTRRYETETTFQQVTELGIVVDLESGTVIHVGVSAPFDPETGHQVITPRQLPTSTDDTAILRDLASGKVIASGSPDSVLKKAAQCPEGFADD